MQQRSACIFVCLCLSMTAAAADKIVIPATLRSVTVYRSGAELVHDASARLEQGSNEVVIGDVSNSIDETSIRIGCSAGVTIMSVTFFTDYLKPETTTPFVRKLLDSLAALKKSWPAWKSWINRLPGCWICSMLTKASAVPQPASRSSICRK